MRNYTQILYKEPFDGEYTAPSIIVTLAIGIALFNCLELALLIMTTFKRWKGLYFWSLSISNFGVAAFAFGMMMDYFRLAVMWACKILVSIGWMAMIACQSLVLYSRLGLILDNELILRAVKWMIIINNCLLLNITTVLDWGFSYSKNSHFKVGYYYIELIQMTVFTIQELIISGLYVWKTLALLKVISKEHTRSMVMQVLIINIIIICMDIGLVVLQYKHLQLFQESLKILVYSIKLKLEMNILSKLVDLVHGTTQANRSMTLEVIDSNAVPGQAQKDIKREMSGPEPVLTWYSNDGKGSVGQLQNDYAPDPKPSPSVSGSSPDNDAISRVLSHPSINTTRTSGRESDNMYAEYLRSMR